MIGLALVTEPASTPRQALDATALTLSAFSASPSLESQ